VIAAVKSAIIYFVSVFAAGFILGTIRTLIVIPRTGELTAVALELPLMIAIAWFTCGWVLRRWPVPARLVPRMIMSGVAFALLMLGELGVSMLLAGRSVAQHLMLFQQWPTQLGLLGQLPFVLFPVVMVGMRPFLTRVSR
jgi:hypothetical protein